MPTYMVRRRPRGLPLSGRLGIAAVFLLAGALAADRFGFIDLPSLESALTDAHHWVAARRG